MKNTIKKFGGILRGHNGSRACNSMELARSERLPRWSRVTFARRCLRNRRGEAWVVRGYQAGSLESRALRKVHCDGRDVGKTSEIEIIAAWASVALPNREMLIATQCENHLFPLMDRIAPIG